MATGVSPAAPELPLSMGDVRARGGGGRLLVCISWQLRAVQLQTAHSRDMYDYFCYLGCDIPAEELVVCYHSAGELTVVSFGNYGRAVK